METLRDKKFNPAGKVRVVNASISQTNTSSLAFVLVPLGESGKPDSKTYTILDKKWSKVKAEAKGWWQSQFDFKLGNTHETAVQSDIWISHMLCIDKTGKVDEKALASCIKKVGVEAKSNKASIHVSAATIEQVPALGTHLQGLMEDGLNVFIYKKDTEDAKPVE